MRRVKYDWFACYNPSTMWSYVNQNDGFTIHHNTILWWCEGDGGNFSNAIHVLPTWSRQKTEKQFFLHLFGINWTLTICCSVYFCVLGYVVMVCWRWQSYKTVIINHTYLTYFYKIYHGKMPVQIIHYNCVSIGCDLLWGRRNFISNFCDKIR